MMMMWCVVSLKRHLSIVRVPGRTCKADTFITRGGEGLEDKNEYSKATRSEGMGLEECAIVDPSCWWHAIGAIDVVARAKIVECTLSVGSYLTSHS